ncbi:helix-hairpin-helix domain-containing protein [Cryobacterium sp. TMT1-3]|uniref:Helix-hairpin-helix domain-containing protein n=1 Tax=Cryobacterium luteum TaxID=1424661 RepID=A0A1H8GP99_9MICO|nr:MULTISPECIES: helix-hairpin-helix domain-containing protein [Cryobacterium]TFB84647.1 helix-hairpin-helix domain-containing protein [Cryobacterium luteum]TFC28403.1 helix-hairpin-helix domain-containing protein [Cryobacterium sp. TMT1-3]SEN45327.1 competence protein ComEA [Cryobacterium luteum]
MQPDRSPLDLERLAPAARGRPRLRVGVGAAVVLLLLALVVAVIVSAIGQQAGQRTVGSATVSIPSGSSTADSFDAGAGAAPDADVGVIIFVHVLGAVTRPGLFELRDGARVMDAIAAAGGLTVEADPAGVNLARILSDGEQFYVPRQGEVPPAIPAAGSGSGGANAPAAKVNLNSATVADLDSLPRIGPTMAQRIVDFRTTNGRFTSVDGLRDVAGIGDKTFEALKDLITI